MHAALLVWRGPNPYIENDSWALLVILSSACLITVPLLNWSQTLRNLGEKFADPDKKDKHVQSDHGPRIIVIYWGFLVTIGFLCVWFQLIYYTDDSTGLVPMENVICRAGTNASQILSTDGEDYILRAIDDDFIKQNACSNPCENINIPSIFRQSDDMVLLSRSQSLLYGSDFDSKAYQNQERGERLYDKVLKLYQVGLPIILLQGIIVVFFGRRCPHEIRDFIYITLYRNRNPCPGSDSAPRRRSVRWIMQDWFARVVAFFSYIAAIAVVLVCPPFFLAQIIGFEIVTWASVPDAEPPFSIGQWASWSMAVLAILAALIARYHADTVERLPEVFQMNWMNRHKDGRKNRKGRGVDDRAEHDSMRDPEEGIKKTDTSTSASASSDSSPTPPPLPPSTKLPPAKPPRSFRALWNNVIKPAYMISSQPLNQSGTGLGGEIRNFWAWVKDPCAVSKYVSRHPMREEDRGFKHRGDQGCMEVGSEKEREEKREGGREREKVQGETEALVERDEEMRKVDVGGETEVERDETREMRKRSSL